MSIKVPRMLFLMRQPWQLTSVETWGTKFIVPVSLREVELIRIVASHNNTKVTQTGAVLPKTATPAQQTLYT